MKKKKRDPKAKTRSLKRLDRLIKNSKFVGIVHVEFGNTIKRRYVYLTTLGSLFFQYNYRPEYLRGYILKKIHIIEFSQKLSEVELDIDYWRFANKKKLVKKK